MSGFIQKSSFAALAVLTCLGASASAADYQYHHKVNGLVKAAPPAPPEPECVDPRSVAIGTRGNEFCGSLGIDLIYAGIAGDHAVLFALQDEPSSIWGYVGEHVDNPAIPNCTETGVSGCRQHTDGAAYTAAMMAHPNQNNGAARACTSKGEGWYVPSTGELGLMLENNMMAAAGLNRASGVFYHTSVEREAQYIPLLYSSGFTWGWKSQGFALRCARSG